VSTGAAQAQAQAAVGVGEVEPIAWLMGVRLRHRGVPILSYCSS
jgi:hypothetical protein